MQTVFGWYEAGDLLDSGRAYRRWALANPMHYLVMFGRAVPDFVAEPGVPLERGLRSFEALVTTVGQRRRRRSSSERGTTSSPPCTATSCWNSSESRRSDRKHSTSCTRSDSSSAPPSASQLTTRLASFD